MRIRVSRWKFDLVGRRRPARWLISRRRSPYLCLEGKTKSEVIQAAARAMQFYQKARARKAA